MRLGSFPLLEQLSSCKHVVLAGAGGGFDVYAALPLRHALRAAGIRVTLASLSFTYLGGTDAKLLAPYLYEVVAQSQGEERYFPERALARWLEARGESEPVYSFEKVGVAPLRRAYRALLDVLGDVDALVLVDGGTDILLRGDEAGLGTPVEDMASLGAVAGLDEVPLRAVVCIGFGIDTFHGVCHAHWLERVANLAADGAYLGAAALVREMPEARAYLDAVEHATALHAARPSIVNLSIASAVEGEFGNVHRTARTQTSTLFVNPLMSLLWAFDLPAVAHRSLYLRLLEHTETAFEMQALIEAFRHDVAIRPREPIPV